MCNTRLMKPPTDKNQGVGRLKLILVHFAQLEGQNIKTGSVVVLTTLALFLVLCFWWHSRSYVWLLSSSVVFLFKPCCNRHRFLFCALWVITSDESKYLLKYSIYVQIQVISTSSPLHSSDQFTHPPVGSHLTTHLTVPGVNWSPPGEHI